MASPPVQICAIAGGSGAGKTTLANMLLQRLGEQGSHLTIDWYYRDLSHMSPEDRAVVNYDHPDSLEVDLFAHHLGQLAVGMPVDAPIYDFASHTRNSETLRVDPHPVIVTEGIHLLGLADVRERCALTVFIHVDAEVRLERRIRRDVAERGRTPASVKEQWMTTVAPMHDEFVEPSRAFATRVVTIEEDFAVVADEITQTLTN